MFGFLKPKEVVRETRVEVPVPSERLTLYQARVKHWRYSYGCERPDWHGCFFTSCADAFGVAGADAEVVSVDAVKVGEAYYQLGDTLSLYSAPKPKVPKGKKAVR